MKLANSLLWLALIAICMPLAAFADGSFDNQGGTITSKKGAPGTGLYLTTTVASNLTSVTGVTGLDCNPCNGTVTYTTGFTSGFNASLINNVGGPTTVFGGGGSFKITENGGVVFNGTFNPGATWTWMGCTTGCGSQGPYWQWALNGSVSGTYTVGGQTFTVTGGTVQLTTQKFKKDPFNSKTGLGSINLSGGNTTLPTVTPESSALILFGTGLVGVALLARRKMSSGIRGV